MIVYWSILPQEASKNYGYDNVPFYLNIREPVPCIEDFKHRNKDLLEMHNFLRCPCVKDLGNKVYALKSPVEYDLSWDGKQIYSSYYDQSFFNTNVKIKDASKGFISLRLLRYVFFTEHECVADFTPPYMCDNDFAKKSLVLPGAFDISKWFRTVDVSFFFTSQSKINIKEDDSLLYVKFNTKEPITFKKFLFTDKCNDVHAHCLNQKIFKHNKNVKTYLQDIYSRFSNSKLKNHVLKEIKNNLLE